MERLTKKPGEFRARCNLKREIAWDVMTEESWALANARGYKRVFRELPSLKVDPETRKHGRWVVVFGGCEGFETADAAAFERHMADAHGRKPGGPRQLKRGNGMWKGPRLKDEGQPLKTGVELETCTACGLVAEVSERAADVLWWDEHQRLCAGTESAVA